MINRDWKFIDECLPIKDKLVEIKLTHGGIETALLSKDEKKWNISSRKSIDLIDAVKWRYSLYQHD